MFSIKYQNNNFYMEGKLDFPFNILNQMINYLYDLNIFDKETFFLTEDVESVDSTIFDKNKYLIIKFNKDSNFKEVNFPFKAEYFKKKIINVFQRLFYVFDKFIILIKLKDDIIDIENNNFNFNPNYLNTNPEILFNFVSDPHFHSYQKCLPRNIRIHFGLIWFCKFQIRIYQIDKTFIQCNSCK